MGPDLSRRLLGRHVRRRAEDGRGRRHHPVLAASTGGPAASTPRLGRPGPAWPARTARAGRPGSCRPSRRLDPAAAPVKDPAGDDHPGHRGCRPAARRRSDRASATTGARPGGPTATRPRPRGPAALARRSVGDAAARRRRIARLHPVQPRRPAATGPNPRRRPLSWSPGWTCRLRRARSGVGWRRAPTAAAAARALRAARATPAARREVSDRRPDHRAAVRRPRPGGPGGRADRSRRRRSSTIPEPTDLDVRLRRARSAAGMGFRVPLTADQAARGFDRIVVARASGCAPTPGGGAGRSTSCSRATASAGPGSRSCRRARRPTTPRTRRGRGTRARRSRRWPTTTCSGRPKFARSADPLAKRDGQVLAERLGLTPRCSPRTRGADGRDAAEAQAMNIALAPGNAAATWPER